MKAGFFFDTYLLENNEKDYIGMTLNWDFFNKRYLSYYDELIVSTRVKKIEEETGNYSGYKIVNGKSVEVIPIKSYNNIPDYFFNKKQMIKEIKNVLSKIDIAIIRMPSMIGNATFDLCEKLGKPYIIEMVACAWDGYINHKSRFGKIVAPYMFYATKKRIRKSKKTLYVTNRFLQKRYPTNGVNISCSDVILKEFDINILNKRLKKIDALDNNEPIALCTVANVGLKYKGHEYAFKALAKLKLEGYKFKYYLAGNGNCERLKKLVNRLNIKNEVVFLGSLNHDEIFNLLDKIDIYIQPSLQEGLPRALLEAMSRACPSIGSNAGGIPELLPDDCVFKKKKWKRLYFILKGIDKEKLKKYSIANYNVSKQYDKEHLDIIRDNFYKIK